MSPDETKLRVVPWYAEGLRFECQPDCGACCTNQDADDQVYLEKDDLPRLAAFFGLSREEFAARHTVVLDGHTALRGDTPDCPFLDGRRCTVYDARPTQCRTFPFWPETLASPRAWKRLSRYCPGIDRGELHPVEAIQARLAEHDPRT